MLAAGTDSERSDWRTRIGAVWMGGRKNQSTSYFLTPLFPRRPASSLRRRRRGDRPCGGRLSRAAGRDFGDGLGVSYFFLASSRKFVDFFIHSLTFERKT